tara:strand:+ start:1111 stop:2337 length:1227 start_codon:yes stop_codon:yes gene_type:complete
MAEAINPIVTNIARDEVISDPFVREAYFGSPDTPGIISQAITAANRSFGQPAILRQTAGLSPLELAAMQGAYGGLGSYQPYLDASTRAYQEGMGMSRRAGQLAQPYFSGEQAYLGAATDTARRAAGMQFDPNLTRQFFDPFEDRVVQQTIDDVFKRGELQDIDARTRDISQGGESAFGSRARLSADERRAALGRGLGEALAGIRSQGFGQAQQAALGEFGRQAGARERLADTLAGFGSQLGGIGGRRAGLARNIGSDIAGYGTGIGGLGRDVVDLGIRSRGELSGLGATARGLTDTALGREYDQAVQTRMAPTQAAQFVRGFLPTYQSGRTQVATTYGAPADPLSAGLGTFLSTYANFAKPQTTTSNNPSSTAATAGGAGAGAATPAVVYGNPYGQYNPYAGGGTYTT